ncbi:MAG: hypothetical protein D6814_10020 [Calditrichaeota bacterium]|nr:MAG: hypothetical protein D6814_10020 [Calditrichota bacterium]
MFYTIIVPELQNNPHKKKALSSKLSACKYEIKLSLPFSAVPAAKPQFLNISKSNLQHSYI